ncbi:MAG: hypothetical protein M0C28_46405 [Candidatus Moduliflexus flocculans]|nr:hypothetical protein [Candidatus Moduliflexus flocculans]
MSLTLAEHYGKKAERFRRDARGLRRRQPPRRLPASRAQVAAAGRGAVPAATASASSSASSTGRC